MKLSDCKTMEDLKEFRPSETDKCYYTGSGEKYHVTRLGFMASEDRKSFLAVPSNTLSYGYGNPLDTEVFNDKEEADRYFYTEQIERKQKTIGRIKEQLQEAEIELAMLQRKKQDIEDGKPLNDEEQKSGCICSGNGVL